ncbi:MAG: cation:proton antiporter, partial [Clostridia bacterium]|nr:cation:proton antiporter [Clostridia bacterium]
IGKIIGLMIAFFAVAVALGFGLHFLFNFIEKRHPHTRRIPIIGFAICFFMSYAAEKWFGVADITGAFVAGIILSTVREHEYIDRKVEISNYLIFGPVFFANIGLTADFRGITAAMVGFGFLFILAGILGKVVGCGVGSLMCRYSFKDSLRVGVGMMVRAEVVLVCTQKGIDSGLVNPNIMPFVLILIVLTTLLTPLILKLLYKGEMDGTPSITTGGTEAPAENAEASLNAEISEAPQSEFVPESQPQEN